MLKIQNWLLATACLLAFARDECLRRLETGADFAGDEATGTGEYPERHYLRARRWMPVEYQGAFGFYADHVVVDGVAHVVNFVINQQVVPVAMVPVLHHYTL